MARLGFADRPHETEARPFTAEIGEKDDRDRWKTRSFAGYAGGPLPTASLTQVKPSARSSAASSVRIRETSPGPW